jgi:hypothetical protein
VVSGEYECASLSIANMTNISNIKVVSYSYSNKEEIISLMIYSKKEVVYCQLERLYPTRTFSVAINYHVSQDHLPDLIKMSIQSLFFDSGYKIFLVLRLRSDETGVEKVVVYDRPYIRPNSTSSLIGHVIAVF